MMIYSLTKNRLSEVMDCYSRKKTQIVMCEEKKRVHCVVQISLLPPQRWRIFFYRRLFMLMKQTLKRGLFWLSNGKEMTGKRGTFSFVLQKEGTFIWHSQYPTFKLIVFSLSRFLFYSIIISLLFPSLFIVFFI